MRPLHVERHLRLVRGVRTVMADAKVRSGVVVRAVLRALGVALAVSAATLAALTARPSDLTVLAPQNGDVFPRVQHLESTQSPSAAVNDPGSRLFRTHCATCHGVDGRGGGPMANQLRRTPPDLTQYAARNGGLFPSEKVRRIIDGRDISSHGIGDMPVWGDVFRKTDDATEAAVKARIDAIVRYLQAIQARAA
jgi:mono/diheme cytochrome c family protein